MNKRRASGLVMVTLGAIGVVANICNGVYSLKRSSDALNSIHNFSTPEARQIAMSESRKYDSRANYANCGVYGSTAITVIGNFIYQIGAICYKRKKE